MLVPQERTCQAYELHFSIYFYYLFKINTLNAYVLYVLRTNLPYVLQVMSTYDKVWFSAKEISRLGARRVAGLPKTESGSRRHILQDGWLSREVKGSGGPGGILTEYQPPADVLALIHLFLEASPEFFKEKRGKAFTSSPAQDGQSPGNNVTKQQMAEYIGDKDNLMATKRLTGGSEPACAPFIDEGMLNVCHDACRSVYGDAFDGQSAAVQFGYAVDLYNLLVKMSAQYGGLEQMKRLETVGVADLLNVFIRLGWARKFPPPTYAFF